MKLDIKTTIITHANNSSLLIPGFKGESQIGILKLPTCTWDQEACAKHAGWEGICEGHTCFWVCQQYRECWMMPPLTPSLRYQEGPGRAALGFSSPPRPAQLLGPLSRPTPHRAWALWSPSSTAGKRHEELSAACSQGLYGLHALQFSVHSFVVVSLVWVLFLSQLLLM